MSFASVLDAYCNALGCTNREIADRCGISPSSLSRYRNGERTPEVGSDALSRIVKGLSAFSDDRGSDSQWREGAIRNALESSLSKAQPLGLSFSARVDAIMDLANLRNADVARIADISPSYVSRIRNGQRMPSDQGRFARHIARIVSTRCVERGIVAQLVALVDSAGEIAVTSNFDLDSTGDLAILVERWLVGDNIVESDLEAVDGLLGKLNDFYFNDELERIKKLMPAESEPGQPRPFSRFYHGLSNMKEAEMTFFEIAAAHNVGEVYLSSDMPLLELSIEPDFRDNYHMRIGNLIRKGCHVTVIHGAERPLAETVVALELWLPLYLTGHVTPYYLRGSNSRLFCHVNYVCDSCGMASEAVMGHQAEGRYYLTTKPEEIAYYQQKMGFIMEHVSSMLELYHEGDPALESRLAQLAADADSKTSEAGRLVGVGKYDNLRIVSYPGRCAVVSVLCDPAVHLVIRHPKLRYVISHMR